MNRGPVSTSLRVFGRFQLYLFGVQPRLHPAQHDVVDHLFIAQPDQRRTLVRQQCRGQQLVVAPRDGGVLALGRGLGAPGPAGRVVQREQLVFVHHPHQVDHVVGAAQPPRRDRQRGQRRLRRRALGDQLLLLLLIGVGQVRVTDDGGQREAVPEQHQQDDPERHHDDQVPSKRPA